MIGKLTYVICLATCQVGAAEAGDAAAIEGAKRFAEAYAAWDAAGFTKAADLFAEACRVSPKSSTNFYWLGVAEYHRLLLLAGSSAVTNRATVNASIQAALRALTTAIDLNGRDAEVHALLANVYGISISASPTRALWLGPRVLKHKRKALEFAGDNPRVYFLVGLSQFHGPESLGGKEKALSSFLKAAELFAQEAQRPAWPLAPRWGRNTCLAFAGKTYNVLGHPEEAKRCFLQALDVNPQDRLARAELEKRGK